MRRGYLIAIVAAAVFFFALEASAQMAGTVKEEGKADYLENLAHLNKFTDPVKRTLKENKIDLNFFTGTLLGYDNNVNLDPERRGDGFFEFSMNTEAGYNYTPDIRLKIENDVTNVTYFAVHDANLVDVYTEGGYEVDLFDDLFTAEANYAFDVSLFPEDPDGSYLGNHVRTFLKHNITQDLYQKAGWHFLYKGYTSGTTLEANGQEDDTLRKDLRNAAEYEIGMYFDKAIIKTRMDFFYNESNYDYFDYYDYWSFRVSPSMIFMITEKFYTTGSITYQQRNYKGRLSSKNDEHVTDKTVSYNISVLYDLTKSFTFAFNYSYRENWSNEPLQQYSGSIMTWGLYYSF